jgi:hypothetical protein
MIWRGFSWLLAFFALVAALASEHGPWDPVPLGRESVAPEAPAALLVYHWADRDPRIGRLEGDLADPAFVQIDSQEWERRVAGTVRPAPRMVAYGSSPSRVQAFAQALQLLALAERHELEQPVRIDTELTFWLCDPGSASPAFSDSGATILPLGPPGFAERILGTPEVRRIMPGLHFAGSSLLDGRVDARLGRERAWGEDSARVWSKIAPTPAR